MFVSTLRTLSAVLALLFLGLAANAVVHPATAQTKKLRVAVIDFEDKTDNAYLYYRGRQQRPGEGMADMLTTALFKTGRYDVIERDKLAELLAEQDLGAAGIVTPETAAEMGKILGADALVFGTVSEFGYRERDTGGVTRRLGVGVSSATAEVAVDVRIVNSSTGQLLAADNVRASQSARGLKLDTQKLDFATDSEFDNSLVGKATREAIDGIVGLLDAQAGNVAWSATVVTFRDGLIYINAGASSGVEVGDTFKLVRPGEALIDPETGLNLGSVEQTIGACEVVNNQVGDGAASQCRPIEGTDFQRGDLVRQE